MLSSQVWPCSQYEAQFKGTIKEIVYQNEHSMQNQCFIYLQFDLSAGDIFEVNRMCPLTIDEALVYPVFLKDCDQAFLFKGQSITGILTRVPDAHWLLIE